MGYNLGPKDKMIYNFSIILHIFYTRFKIQVTKIRANIYIMGYKSYYVSN